MTDYFSGINPGHPGGIAPLISFYSRAMAGEIEAHCRAACPQPGRMRALWISELTEVSCTCTDPSSLSSQPLMEKLHLRHSPKGPCQVMAHQWHCKPCPLRKFSGGALTWFKLKLHLQEWLRTKNNSLAESCLPTVQFRHLTSSPYTSSPFPTTKERGEPTSSRAAPRSPFLGEQ